MTRAEFAIEILRTLRWPAVWVLCILGVAFILKSPLTGFVGRWRVLRFFGEQARIEADAAPTQLHRPAEPLAAAGVVAAPGAPPIVANIAEATAAVPFTYQLQQAMLLEVENAVERFPTGPVRELALKRMAAVAAVNNMMERTNFVIYGSQLAALQFLNSTTPQSLDVVRGFYDRAKADHPSIYSNLVFEDWLQFLKSNGLVDTTPDDKVLLAPGGHDFLKFLLDRRYSTFRAL